VLDAELNSASNRVFSKRGSSTIFGDVGWKYWVKSWFYSVILADIKGVSTGTQHPKILIGAEQVLRC
jgi:hypothetical protein